MAVRDNTWTIMARDTVWELVTGTVEEGTEAYPTLFGSGMIAVQKLPIGKPVLATGGPLLTFTLGK